MCIHVLHVLMHMCYTTMHDYLLLFKQNCSYMKQKNKKLHKLHNDYK